MISKLERDFMAADLESVESLLGELTDSDFIARWSLESRRDEIKTALAVAQTRNQPLASAALFFAGQPVDGRRGIQSEFGAQAIALFQNIVSKVAASHATKMLAPVGPVSGKDKSRLYVTRIVHGSFGFQFEELDNPVSTSPMFDSALKESVDETVHLMAAFDESEETVFGVAVESIDTRILSTIRRFFALVHNSNATFRMVSGNVEKQYDTKSIERAMKRAKETSIIEQDQWFKGRLEGVLPTNRDFEYRTTMQEVIRGKIDWSLSVEQIANLNKEWLARESEAHIRVKQIMRQGRLSHKALLLLSLRDDTSSAGTIVNIQNTT